MNNCFCTIITGNYYPFAQALLESLLAHSSQPVHLQILVTDAGKDKTFLRALESDHLHFSFPEEITHPFAEAIFQLYHSHFMDAYRWSMKPVFLHYLLKSKGYEKVIFLDPDLFFFNDPGFLFDLLDEHRVILTPHWAVAENPEQDLENFQVNFLSGVYNAGFVGVRQDAEEIMDFWANLCRVKCEINKQKGFFVDQRYLDILHSRFEGVGVVRHRGCNISDWNYLECQRITDSAGDVLINGIYPVIFIHFSLPMMVNCISGRDEPLRRHFIHYAETVKKYGPAIDLLQQAAEQLARDNRRARWEEIRSRVRLRTRIRQGWKKIMQLNR